MSKIVISQPMFFPWVGIFEQIKLSDIYVHYDDVQFPLGRSFINRVQLKTIDGSNWLTAPVKKSNSLSLIKDVFLDDSQNWKRKHLNSLHHNYANAPHKKEMLSLVEEIYDTNLAKIAELNIYAIEKIWEYLEIKEVVFLRSSDLNIDGSSSERLIKIIKKIHSNEYITGHGAKNYMNHDLFENENISVNYMNYEKIPYTQLYGDFNPYVSILDLIANLGKSSKNYIISNTIYWKDFLNDTN